MKKCFMLFMAVMFLIIQASCSYALDIFNINTPVLSEAQVGKSASYRFTVTDMGGKSTAGVDWRMSGSVPGMSFSNATATLSGTPTRAGFYSFSVTASRRYSTNYTPASATVSCTLNVKAADNSGKKLTITGTFSDGQTGIYYSQSISVSGGTTPYKSSLTNGYLPVGLWLDTTSYNGGFSLTGTPTNEGTYDFTVKIEDSKGNTTEQKFNVKIDSSNTNPDPDPDPTPTPPAPTPTPSDLKITGTFENGMTEMYYSQTVSVSGGTTSYTFTVTNGDLPDGLELITNSFWGEISLTGTPTKAGTYSFTVKIEDSKGKTIEKEFTIKIDSAPEPIEINSTNFPNATFRAHVKNNFDKNADGYLSYSEIASATKIELKEKGLNSLKGVEFLTALTELYCEKNHLTELDVTRNTALKYLNCNENQLTKLDLNNNTALWYLNCNANRLTELDLSHNTALAKLYCEHNKLAKLDLNNNTALWYLDCSYNQLAKLDLNSATLRNLDCSYNQLTELDLSKAQRTLIILLSSAYHQASPTLKYTKKGDLYYVNMEDHVSDISRLSNVRGNYGTYDANTGVITFQSEPSSVKYDYDTIGDGYFKMDVELTPDPNQSPDPDPEPDNPEITTSNLPNGLKGTSYNAVLQASGGTSPYTWTKSGGILPTGLSLNKSTGSITGEPTEANSFTFTIKVTDSKGASGTKQFTVTINEPEPVVEIQINAINFPDSVFRSYVSRNFDTDSNGYLNDSEIAKAKSINVWWEDISSMKGIEFFKALTYLDCSRNQLTTLDVTKNTALEYLYCYENQLTTLDVTKNTVLKDLYCHSNQLTALDVTQNTVLKELSCGDNQITALDVTKNTDLTHLDCAISQLTTLNVSKNTALKSLWCNNNQLTALDISKNTALISLWCDNNQLTTLDVSKNTVLTTLYCYNNQLTTLDVSNSTALTSLSCFRNLLTELDVSKNIALEILNCEDNKLTALDLSKNTALEYLNFSNNSNDTLVPEKQTDGTYKVDLMNHVPDFSRVSDIAGDVTKGYYYPNGVLICYSMPSFVAYNYDTKSPLSSKQKMYVVITLKDSMIPAPEITTSSLPQGKSGQQYDAELSVSGGTSPYTWIISGGTFPTGLTIDNTTGKISGTPAKAGSFTFKVKVTDANGKTNEASFTMNIENGAQVTTPKISGTLNNGIKKASYTGTLKVTGGTSPYKWSISSGALPTGLTLNESTGKISGIPTTAGTFKFTVKITDANKSTATKTYTVKITKPSISGTLSNGIKYASYIGTLKASGGTSPYKWSISEGALPTGLTIGESNGKISGTPTAAGTFKFTVKVADANNSAVTKAYTVKITKPSISGTLSNGIKYASYTGTLKASNGTAPYTWEIIDGTLPDGLTIGESTGKISGKPTKAGTFKFTVKVTDANSSAVTKAYSIKITKTTISGTLSNGIKYASYSNTLKASNGTAPYTWSISAGTLPDGLAIGESNGKISGTPTKAGTFKFTVKVTDKNNSAATKEFTVKITKPSISGTLSTGTVGVSYSKTLKATGGTASYTWTKSGGTLPSGLKLGKTTGKITGTPTKAGKFTFNVKVTDANNSTATKSFTVTIKSAETAAADITDEIYENIHFSETGDSPDSNNETLYGYEEPVMQNENIEVSDELHSYTAINLKIAGDDILNQGTDRDEDIAEVRAYMPVRFIAEARLNSSEEMQVYVDDELAESIIVSDNGEFTLPAEMIHDDFKVQVKAGIFESHELYIIATEQ